MHIRLLCVGKIRERYIRLAVDDFLKRLRPYHQVEELEVRAAEGSDARRMQLADSLAVLDKIARGDRVWLLDREGMQLASEELAWSMRDEEENGRSHLTFVIGGAFGFNELVRDRANVRWSMSKLTFLHEWSRALVLEQIYRATKIRRNEPYHH